MGRDGGYRDRVVSGEWASSNYGCDNPKGLATIKTQRELAAEVGGKRQPAPRTQPGVEALTILRRASPNLKAVSSCKYRPTTVYKLHLPVMSSAKLDPARRVATGSNASIRSGVLYPLQG